MATERTERTVEFGETVYDEDGEPLGRVSNFANGGFYVSTHHRVSPSSQAESKAGEKTLMWRCGECGEMGDIKNIPQLCPSCGASGESIYYLQED